MSASREEIERFLEAYGMAVSAGDGESVAEMWQLPALVLSDEGALAVSTREQVVDFFSQAPAQYRSLGIAATAAEAVAIEHLSDHLCSVNVRWLGIDASGSPTPHRELSSYVLRRGSEGTIRVQVAMSLPSRTPAD